MTPSTVVVATFHRRHEAEIARGYLTDAGIAATVSADDGGGVFGVPLSFTEASFATVTVREEDAERARRVLRAAGILPAGDR